MSYAVGIVEDASSNDGKICGILDGAETGVMLSPYIVLALSVMPLYEYHVRWLSEKSVLLLSVIFLSIEFDSEALIAANAQQAPVTPWSLMDVDRLLVRRSYLAGRLDACLKPVSSSGVAEESICFLPSSST